MRNHGINSSVVLTGHPQHQRVSSIRAPAVKKPMDVVNQEIRFGHQFPLAANRRIRPFPHAPAPLKGMSGSLLGNEARLPSRTTAGGVFT
jgi:hypothetical protein